MSGTRNSESLKGGDIFFAERARCSALLKSLQHSRLEMLTIWYSVPDGEKYKKQGYRSTAETEPEATAEAQAEAEADAKAEAEPKAATEAEAKAEATPRTTANTVYLKGLLKVPRIFSGF